MLLVVIGKKYIIKNAPHMLHIHSGGGDKNVYYGGGLHKFIHVLRKTLISQHFTPPQ